MDQNERIRALSFLKTHGNEPISWQTLESSFSYWFRKEGFVGYVDTGKAWVAAGPPVGPPNDVESLAQMFIQDARSNNRRAVFFGAEKSLIARGEGKALCIGLRPHWNPQIWSLSGPRQASLRYQLRRAMRNGVRVRRVFENDLRPGSPLRLKIESVVREWENRHAIAPMGFIVSLELYVFPEHHIYLVAETDDAVVGILSAVPVFSNGGWFVEDLLRSRNSPNGTSELLVHSFLELARDGGSEYVTLGLEPLAGPLIYPLKVARWALQPFFSFTGLEHFKEKLNPVAHERRYILGAPESNRFVNLIDVLTAFSRFGLVRFALASIARSPWAATKISMLRKFFPIHLQGSSRDAYIERFPEVNTTQIS